MAVHSPRVILFDIQVTWINISIIFLARFWHENPEFLDSSPCSSINKTWVNLGSGLNVYDRQQFPRQTVTQFSVWWFRSLYAKKHKLLCTIPLFNKGRWTPI